MLVEMLSPLADFGRLYAELLEQMHEINEEPPCRLQVIIILVLGQDRTVETGFGAGARGRELGTEEACQECPFYFERCLHYPIRNPVVGNGLPPDWHTSIYKQS